MEAIDLSMKKLVNRNDVLEKRLKASKDALKELAIKYIELQDKQNKLMESIKKFAEGAETEYEVTPCGWCGHVNIWGGDDGECEGCGPGGHTCPSTALPVAECGCADCTPEKGAQ